MSTGFAERTAILTAAAAQSTADAAMPKSGGTFTGPATFATTQALVRKPRTITDWTTLPSGVYPLRGAAADVAAGVTLAAGAATLSVRNGGSNYKWDYWQPTGLIIPHDCNAFDVNVKFNNISATWTGDAANTISRFGLFNVIGRGDQWGAWFGCDVYYKRASSPNSWLIEKGFKAHGTTGASTWDNNTTVLGDAIPTRVWLRLVWDATQGFKAYYDVTNDVTPVWTELGSGSAPTGFVDPIGSAGAMLASAACLGCDGQALVIALGETATTNADLSVDVVSLNVSSAS